MHCLAGSVHVNKTQHRIAYCGQNPCRWPLPVKKKKLTDSFTGLEHATIRDNIIFGSPYGYDKTRYDQVTEACALLPDLKILPAGDFTGI